MAFLKVEKLTYIVDGFPEDQSAQLKVRRLSLDEYALGGKVKLRWVYFRLADSLIWVCFVQGGST